MRKPPESKLRPLKDFLLLLAGALAGLLTTVALQPQPDGRLIIATAAGFMLSAAYGLSLVDRLALALTRAVRDHRGRHRPIVGVLSDIRWNQNRESMTSWANVSSAQWLEYLRPTRRADRSSLRAAGVTFGSNLDRLNVILNPYGGVYPEQDTIGLENLNTIFDWVADGGLFVNVADLPGYWMYNTRMETKVDATPTVYAFIPQGTSLALTSVRPFEKTPFVERLSIRILNVEGVDPTSWQLSCNWPTLSLDRFKSLKTERLAVIEKNIQPIITYQRAGTDERLTSLFWVPYGRGSFLFSLYFLDERYPQNTGVVSILIQVVQNRVAHNKSLKPTP